MPLKLIYFSLLALCGGYALIKGGGPERIGAAIWIADSVFTPLMRSWSVHRYYQFEPAVMILDLVVLAALLVLAIYSNRFWPLWVAAIHAIGCFAHIAKALHPEINPWAYANMVAIGGYPICLLLLWGTIRHRRRLRQFGADRSWSGSLAL